MRHRFCLRPLVRGVRSSVMGLKMTFNNSLTDSCPELCETYGRVFVDKLCAEMNILYSNFISIFLGTSTCILAYLMQDFVF